MVASESPPSLLLPSSLLRLQSSGSPVHLPLGQSDASMAEHWPMQLVPRPHVTLVSLLSLVQQLTSIESLKNVKEESKKSTSDVVVLSLKKNIRIRIFHR